MEEHKMVEFIRDRLDQEELLCQLAEEAAELSKAALKLRRAYGNTNNPTPISAKEAYENLVEEAADVYWSWFMLGFDNVLSRTRIHKIVNEKMIRCAERLQKDGERQSE